MAPKFGTSGLRGLVTELTPELVASYVKAFVSICPTGAGLFVGRDLRPSSPRIAADVIAAAREAGINVTDCGALPTPALALAAMGSGAGAVMVTGSHIPADRNGLKFYVPSGEITKSNEIAITNAVGTTIAPAAPLGVLTAYEGAAQAYVQRYAKAFRARALAGLRLGVYQHSSVARDLLTGLVEALGATAVPLARSETFIPVDTEAVDAETRTMLADWCGEHRLDAVLSTDGDADRPMLADAIGTVVPGDILGVLSARALGAKVVCTPISSNSMVLEMPDFEAVHLTRIGSPFVIAAMQAVREATPGTAVVGFEANGGFLLGFNVQGPAGTLDTLMTRDAVLPLLVPLMLARAKGATLAQIVAELPARFTASDRLTETPTEKSAALLDRLGSSEAVRADFLAPLGTEIALDRTDGLRLTLDGARVLHLRPSGNAPEFRIYTEASSKAECDGFLSDALHLVRAALAR